MASNVTMAGMAGLGVTAKGWKYTGPRSRREVATLTTVSRRPTRATPCRPGLHADPTAAQTLGAVQYVQAVSAAVSKYAVLADATAAATCRSPTPPTRRALPQRVRHEDQDILDPNHVDSLVYATNRTGGARGRHVPHAAGGRAHALRVLGAMARPHQSVPVAQHRPDQRFQPALRIHPEGTTPMMTTCGRSPSPAPARHRPSTSRSSRRRSWPARGLAPVTSPGVRRRSRRPRRTARREPVPRALHGSDHPLRSGTGRHRGRMSDSGDVKAASTAVQGAARHSRRQSGERRGPRASVAVTVEGHPVVDLWVDVRRRPPILWARTRSPMCGRRPRP